MIGYDRWCRERYGPIMTYHVVRMKLHEITMKCGCLEDPGSMPRSFWSLPVIDSSACLRSSEWGRRMMPLLVLVLEPSGPAMYFGPSEVPCWVPCWVHGIAHLHVCNLFLAPRPLKMPRAASRRNGVARWGFLIESKGKPSVTRKLLQCQDHHLSSKFQWPAGRSDKNNTHALCRSSGSVYGRVLHIDALTTEN